jgi:hypothetical protein
MWVSCDFNKEYGEGSTYAPPAYAHFLEYLKEFNRVIGLACFLPNPLTTEARVSQKHQQPSTNWICGTPKRSSTRPD